LLGAGVVFVGVGDGLGGLGSRNCSHCWPAPLTMFVVGDDPGGRAVLDWAAGAATENHVAVATRTLPVKRLTLIGRTCAKRMKAPASTVRCCCGTTYSVWSGCIRRETPGSCGTPTIGHQMLCLAPLSPVPSRLLPDHGPPNRMIQPFTWDDPWHLIGSLVLNRYDSPILGRGGYAIGQQVPGPQSLAWRPVPAGPQQQSSVRVHPWDTGRGRARRSGKPGGAGDPVRRDLRHSLFSLHSRHAHVQSVVNWCQISTQA